MNRVLLPAAYCDEPMRLNDLIPAFDTTVTVHWSVTGVVCPLYRATMGRESHWFSVTGGPGGISGPIEKFEHDPLVLMPVMINGFPPVFVIVTV